MRMIRLLMLALLLPVFLVSAAETISLPEVLELSRQAVAEKYPDADSVLLHDVQSAVYQPDGLGTMTDDFYQKALNEAGRRSLRELKFYFNTTYEKFELPVVEVIRPDGSVVKVDTAVNGKVAISPGQMGANIYDPANKVMTVTIPELAIGDIVHVVSVEKSIKARIPGVWCGYFVLQADVPILKYVVRVDAPAEKPLKAIALKDEVPGTVTFSEKKEQKRILYSWVAENVPQVIPEPDMPPLYSSVQRLLVSTAANWREISIWYDRLCRPRLTVTPEIRAETEKLIRNARTPEEKIMALFQFVSQQIRYMGVTAEAEAPGYEPHDIALTFNQRYGVCRDKAALLAAMLREAGFKAYPVLFMSGEPKDDEVPNNYFNHAIVAVEDTPGHYILMDPTYETTAELLPSTMANMSYLVARPQGDVLRRSPLVPTANNLLRIKTEAAIAPDGTLLKTWGGPGDAPGKFYIPHSLCVDKHNRVWVGDREANSIHVFDEDGNILGYMNQNLYQPTAMWTDGTYVYAAERGGGLTIINMDMDVVAQLGFYNSPIRSHGMCGNSKGELFLMPLTTFDRHFLMCLVPVK